MKKEGENAIPLGFENESQTAGFFSDLAEALNDSDVFKKKYLKDKKNFKLYMAGVNAKGTKEEPTKNNTDGMVEFWDATSPIEVLIEIPNLTHISPPQGESFADDERRTDDKHLMNVEWSSKNTIQALGLDKFLADWEGLGRHIDIQLLKKKYSETYHAG